MKRNKTKITRREFVQGAGAAAAVAGAGPTLLSACGGGGGTTDGGGTKSLKILQWTHFIPRYDTWFDGYAQSWGQNNHVDVMVDHAPLTGSMGTPSLSDTVNMEIMANGGHDLIEFISAPSSLEMSVMDLKDINMEAQTRFGQQKDVCTKSSYNTKTGKYYGFCHGWVADPGNYPKSLWQAAGLPNGPASYADLHDGGMMIKAMTGKPVGIGMSQELDSNMACRALLWSYGAKVQDAMGQVALDSMETRMAIEYMKQLYTDAMDMSVEDIFSWVPASNNQELVAGNVSYIINSISAYRSAQAASPTVANDIFFTPALTGPGGMGYAGTHVIYVYVIPKWSQNADAAKQFLLDLVANAASDQVTNSELYNFPAFPGTVTDLTTQLATDPFGSSPPDKLKVMQNAGDWTVNQGYPGTANAAAIEVFNSSFIPQMFAQAVQGSMTTDQAVMWALDKINPVYDKWRMQGLI